MTVLKIVSDILASLVLCTFASTLLVFQSRAVWSVFGIGGLWAAKSLYKSASQRLSYFWQSYGFLIKNVSKNKSVCLFWQSFSFFLITQISLMSNT